MLKKTLTAASIAAIAGAVAVSNLPQAQAKDTAQSGLVQLAACNPCAAKKGGCNPCNPCAAKKAACNPCNPCAAKKGGCNPCNPCAAKKKGY